MPRIVGLDIGTHAIRAVEVNLGRGGSSLRRFGQVTLPYGAVVAGEIVQADAVGAAIRRLWREAGFRTRSVVVGVANQRVVARTADVPVMPDDELRSALQFQVQDLIPIPVDEAILDYQVLEHVAGPEDQPMLRVLLVAAHRDMIATHLAALEGAGLTATRIDIEPFALIRALHSDGLGLGPETDEESDGGPGVAAEAIVDVGAGVTNVVVHERGLPRFVRTLTRGGNTITEAIASELGVDLDQAEDLKRRGDPLSRDPDEARAGQLVAGQLTPLLEEIRGSLDFYSAQPDGGSFRRVIVTGGGSRVPDLEERLHALIGVPVERGNALLGIDVTRAGVPREVLDEARDLLPVPIGLALSGEPVEGEIRRITLLPSEIAVRRAERRQIAIAMAAVGGFAVILLAVFLLRSGQVDDAQRDADRAEDRTAQIRQEIAALQDAGAFEQEIADRRQTVVAVLQNEVAWTRILQEIATVIPNDVWLTSFSGTSAAEGGTISVSGMGFDHTSSARWLLRVGELQSLAGLWLPSSNLGESAGGRQTVSFSSNATLTPAARSDRVERFLEPEQ